MWPIEKVEKIPTIISSTGLIPKTFSKDVSKLGLHENTYIGIQKPVILSTSHLVRKFFYWNPTKI